MDERERVVVADESLVIPDWQDKTPEEREAAIKEYTARKERESTQKELQKYYRAMALVMRWPDNEQFPPLTAEDYGKKIWTRERVRNSLDSVRSQLRASDSKKIEARLRKDLTKSQAVFFGMLSKDAPRKLREYVDNELMPQFAQTLEDIRKGIPHLRKIEKVLEKKLDELDRIECEERRKIPVVIKAMSELSKQATRLYSKIAKADREYREAQSENRLNRLAVLVEGYTRLQSEWADLKCSIRSVAPQPEELPTIRELPLLPDAVWKKLEQAGG